MATFNLSMEIARMFFCQRILQQRLGLTRNQVATACINHAYPMNIAMIKIILKFQQLLKSVKKLGGGGGGGASSMVRRLRFILHAHMLRFQFRLEPGPSPTLVSWASLTRTPQPGGPAHR